MKVEALATGGQNTGSLLQGQLENGLHYVILPRRANQPGVGLFVQVKGGFIAEQRPGERGLAHLIEHLMFHSPTQSAPNELRRFKNVGMPLTFQEPAGGTTNWRESDYFVVARSADSASLDTLLGLYREVTSELIFRPEIVDEQRAEVMREMADKRLGNEVSARYNAAVAPGGPNDMIDAQNSDDVPTASIEIIRTLYYRLYRPENISIVIVGDVDAGQVETLIKNRFGDWRGVGSKPNATLIPAFQADRIAPISHLAAAEGRSSAMITVTSPMPKKPLTRDQQLQAQLMDRIAVRAVNERLTLTQEAGRPGKFGVFIENGEYGHRLIMLWDDFASGQWQPAIVGLKSTACELNTAGLSKQEWENAKRWVLQDLEGRANHIANIQLAKELSHELAAKREPVTPVDLLNYARAWLPTLNSEAGNDWWRKQWQAGVEHIRVESPQLVQAKNADAAIRAIADEATGNIKCKVR